MSNLLLLSVVLALEFTFANVFLSISEGKRGNNVTLHCIKLYRFWLLEMLVTLHLHTDCVTTLKQINFRIPRTSTGLEDPRKQRKLVSFG